MFSLLTICTSAYAVYISPDGKTVVYTMSNNVSDCALVTSDGFLVPLWQDQSNYNINTAAGVGEQMTALLDGQTGIPPGVYSGMRVRGVMDTAMKLCIKHPSSGDWYGTKLGVPYQTYNFGPSQPAEGDLDEVIFDTQYYDGGEEWEDGVDFTGGNVTVQSGLHYVFSIIFNQANMASLRVEGDAVQLTPGGSGDGDGGGDGVVVKLLETK